MPSASDVYDTLQRMLGSELERLQMRRVATIGYPAWVSEVNASGERLFVSVQVDGKATDPYSGGGFRVEIEKSKDAKPASGLNGRALFFQLLTSAEAARLLARQNAVIESLVRPPVAQVEAYPAGSVRDQYLAYFEPQVEFDAVRCWLRFRTRADVTGWADALSPLLADLVDRGDKVLREDKRVLGKGPLL